MTLDPASRAEASQTEGVPLAQFDFAQFQQMAPLNGESIWTYIVERRAARLGIRPGKSARESVERIFNATFRLANEVGFGTMSLRDLCRETGLSMGGLYGYIDSKEHLAEMIEDVVRHASLELPRMFAQVTSPSERLEALVRGAIYQSEMLQPWFYFVFMDSRMLGAPQRHMAKESELTIQATIASLITAIDPVPAHESALLAAHVVALFEDWYVKRWKYRAARVSVDDFADSVLGLLRARLH